MLCPLCNSSVFKNIGRPVINVDANFFRNDFNVVQCTTCEYYFVNPIIDFSQEEWEFLYGQTYFAPMTKWYYRARSKDKLIRLDKIERFNPNKVQKFLDIGCGEGHVLIESMNRGWETHGIDIVDNRIEEAKVIGINFMKGDLISTKFPSNYFNSIFIDSVLEHVINPAEYLQEVSRILKQQGVLYIGVPNEDCLLNDFRALYYHFVKKSALSSKIKPFTSPYHVGGFNKKSLQFALRKFSFEICSFRNFAGRLKFLNVKKFSRDFFIALANEPISLLALALRREDYLEVFARKK